MNNSNGMDYYSYVLMDSRSQEAGRVLESAKGKRPVSGANQGQEEDMYRRAVALAIKQVDTTISRSVVVAHCDEDLSWMQALDPTLRKFVYSKGSKIALIPPTAITLPNVGRDYHTYLTHIVRHYDLLDDVTFFLQGWPLDRSAHVISGVNYLRHFNYIEFGTNILETGPVSDQLRNFMRFVGGITSDTLLPWEFRANTQFGASRKRIRRNDLEFYIKCVEACEKGVPEYGISAESVPYLLEQIWKFIFEP
jgi:hypothetical protein